MYLSYIRVALGVSAEVRRAIACLHFALFLHSPKNAILRCIVRKSPDRPTDAYLAYVRVEYQGFDKTRRAIARF